MATTAPESALRTAFQFLRQHLTVFVGFAAVAAVGRTVQTGAPQLEAWPFQLGLEMAVNAARIGLALAVVGHGSVGGGWRRLRLLLAQTPVERQSRTNRIFAALRPNAVTLAKDIGLYLLIAIGLNLIIAVFVHQPWGGQIMAALGLGSGDHVTPATLFCKNLTVIPFTLVFQVQLLRRIWRLGA